MDCLVGCAAASNGNIRVPITANSLSPWVEVSFLAGDKITVGNQSSPNNKNLAVIKSFEYGFSNGHGCKVEIIDQEGGDFSKFANKLNKNIKRTSEEYGMQVRFGWVYLTCTGAPARLSSPTLTFLPMNIEVDISEGKIRFMITGSDMIQSVFVTRSDDTFGTDDKPIPLKQAIKRLSEETEPKFSVEYVRLESNGEINKDGWNFHSRYGKDGPYTVYNSDNQNKLATIQSWVSSFTTELDKGITATWDSENNKLLLWEDPTPDCNQTTMDKLIIGTWLVNAGKCSNVLSFTPRINWIAAAAALTTAANTAGSTSGETVKKEKDCDVQTRETGIQRVPTVSRQSIDADGMQNAAKNTNKAEDKHMKANKRSTFGLEPIEAELRIQGDPSNDLCNSRAILGRFASVVVINPFYLSGGNGCGEWIANPLCQDILSNKYWMIKGVDHSIREGSYNTTLKLFLAVPGLDFTDGPAGGNGSGGWQVENA